MYARLTILIIVLCFGLISCASSNVSRDVAAQVDKTFYNSGLGDDPNVVDSFYNSSQATKGTIIGGTAGAVTGMMSSGLALVPATATGMILGASYGRYLDANMSLEDELANRGVMVIVLGDQVLIVIPSELLFYNYSTKIKGSAYSTLYLVGQFINRFYKISLKIAAYTSRTGSTYADQTLSQRQAEKIGKFFTASGVNARIIYAEGYGGTHLVDKNLMRWNVNDNYRVEISFEKLYV